MKKQFQFSLQKHRSFSLTILVCLIVFLSAVFSACSSIRLQLNEFNKQEINLPSDMKAAVEDPGVNDKDSYVITVQDDGEKVFVGKKETAVNQITNRISKKFRDKQQPEKIVYIKATESVKFDTLINLFRLIRKANVYTSGLVVMSEKYKDETIPLPTIFEIKLFAETFNKQTLAKPNPLTLVVRIDENKNLSLNSESMGNIKDTNLLTDKLTSIFKERENNGVFREATNEIEKTTFIKASRTLKYGDVAKVIDAVKLSGAQPVAMQIDDLPN